VDWRAICSVGEDRSRDRRALDHLTSSLGTIPGFVEFCSVVESTITPIILLLLFYFQSLFIIKDVNVVTPIICVLGLVMCLDGSSLNVMYARLVKSHISGLT